MQATDVLQDFERAQGTDSDLHNVSVSSSEVRALLEKDPEFFIEFFLADELTSPVPDFHVSVFKNMTDDDPEKQRITYALPREHAKTTLAKLACVKYFLCGSRRFTVYLSNTARIAKNACVDVMGFFKCDNFVSVFGEIMIEKESESEGLWIFVIPLGAGRTKRCILRAVGQGQQMRGINIENRRPDLAVIDDVEDLDNTNSPHLQKQLDTWIFSTFLKALRKDYKLIWLGNMLRKTTLLARLAQRPNWNPTVLGALVVNQDTGEIEPLWPHLWSVERLVEDFKEHQALDLVESWMCEVMNLPGQGNSGIDPGSIRYEALPNKEELLGAFITIDPAFGRNPNLHDETAVVVHGILFNGVTMVLEVRHGHCSEREMFDWAVDLARTWDAWVWGIEAVAAQRVLITLFEMYAMQAMFPPGFIKMRKIVKGADASKKNRILAWVKAMRDGDSAIPLHDLDITTQLLNYDLSVRDQRDDIIDACAFQLPMLAEFLTLIKRHRYEALQIQKPPRPQWGLEITHGRT